jgi:hypothetical protein
LQEFDVLINMLRHFGPRVFPIAGEEVTYLFLYIVTSNFYPTHRDFREHNETSALLWSQGGFLCLPINTRLDFSSYSF